MDNINDVILILVSGAVFMTALYHSIVVMYHRPRLLREYTVYLWLVFIYVGYRFLLKILPQFDTWNNIHSVLDESLQMFAFMQYVRFLGVAMNIDPRGSKIPERYVGTIAPVILIYLIFNNSSVFWDNGAEYFYWGSKMLIRLYLLFGGFVMLLVILKQRSSLFHRLIGAGTISLILFGILSSLMHFLPLGDVGLSALSALVLGFMTDIIFFSGAVGYTIKAEANEKEKAFDMILQKEHELAEERLLQVRQIYEARENERRRIANDLHDDLGGTISSLLIYGGLARQTIDSNPKQSSDMIDKCIVQSQKAMEDLSDIIWSMKFGKGSAGLESRIKNYGVELLRDMDIKVRYDIAQEADQKLNKMLQRKNTLLFAKEAMNNIAKYSNAKQALIRISVEGNKLFIFISDDGDGFEVESTRKGNGLNTLKERMTDLGGDAQITSDPGIGTVISGSFPIDTVIQV